MIWSYIIALSGHPSPVFVPLLFEPCTSLAPTVCHTEDFHNFITHSVGTSFCCSFQTSSFHGYPQFLYWKIRRESPVNFPKDESGFLFSTDFSLEGACFSSVSSKEVSREKTHSFKCVP